MYKKSDWEVLGWSTGDDASGGFTVSRDSSAICERCTLSGPWNLRILANGEMAYRDYAVCRCGELNHIDNIWPDAPKP